MKRAILVISVTFLLYAFLAMRPTFSGTAPGGYSGENGFYCNVCHSSFALNTTGGTVFATGLPVGSYTPGTTYPFSITIQHGTADRTRWGFTITARTPTNQPAGSFTPGPNTAILNNPAEMGHSGAVITPADNQYTYTGLTWTAPGNPAPGEETATFYMVGNAANGSGSTDGDYIYSNTAIVLLPAKLGYFKATVSDGYKARLQWQTLQESNTDRFIIERSVDGSIFLPVDSVPAAGNSTTPRNYEFTDVWPRVFDKTIWYRLKQTDRNGVFAYSPVEKVKLDKPGSYVKSIMPNPIKWGQPFFAEIVSAAPQEVKLSLINMQSGLVHTQKNQLRAGLNTLQLNPSVYIPAGHYYITVEGNNLKQRVSVLVQ
jgi:hypothetical protein